jgi:hypothetical protein
MSTGFRQEEECIDGRSLVATWVVLLPLIVLLALGAYGLDVLFGRKTAAQGVARRPEPAAEVSDVHAGLFRRPAAGELLHEQQRQTLARYGWVEKQRGVVRVPIDVAMSLVAKERR